MHCQLRGCIRRPFYLTLTAYSGIIPVIRFGVYNLTELKHEKFDAIRIPNAEKYQ